MMYFERGLFSYAFATIYSPINTFGPKNALMNKKLWQWVQFVKEALPARTTLMIGTDAKGHVGKHPEDTISNVEDKEDLPSIGECSPETENGNGTQVRTILNDRGMFAANTHINEASGSTWPGSQGSKSRVDYILMDRSTFLQGGYMCNDKKMHQALRASVGK